MQFVSDLLLQTNSVGLFMYFTFSYTIFTDGEWRLKRIDPISRQIFLCITIVRVSLYTFEAVIELPTEIGTA